MAGNRIRTELIAGTERIYQWILDLCNKDSRKVAMRELCERRGCIEGLGPLLWHAFGAVAGLLQELIAIYPAVLAEKQPLSVEQSQRVCHAIGLFQAIGSHPDTGVLLLRSQFLAYVLPLLKLTQHTRPVEHVRLSVLGVICGMLKLNSVEAVRIILGTDLMPLALRQLELGSRMCKTLCAFVLQRILESEVGQQFICREPARLMHTLHTLARVVYQLTLEPETRILKHVVRAYARLADHPLGNRMLQQHLPEQLRNGFFCQQNLAGYEQAPNEIYELNRKVANQPRRSSNSFKWPYGQFTKTI